MEEESIIIDYDNGKKTQNQYLNWKGIKKPKGPTTACHNIIHQRCKTI